MKLHLRNAWAQLQAEKKHLDFAREFLSYKDPSAEYKQRFLHWKVPAQETLLKNDGRFPAGLARALYKALKAQFPEEPLEIEDGRLGLKLPENIPTPSCIGGPGYEYQIQAYRRALQTKRGLIWIPTGGGKGNIAAALMASIPGEWIFIVRSRDLLYTFQDRWTSLFPSEVPGIMGDGQWTRGRVNFATAQTLIARLKEKGKESLELAGWLAHLQGMIVDEVHGLPASTMFALAMKIGAPFRIGFSGTPLDRGDKRSIYAIGAMGPVIFRVTAPELVKLGVLAFPKIKMVRCAQYVQAQAQNWRDIEKACITESLTRNRIVAQMAEKAEKPCLVFVSKKAHGRLLADEIRYRGMRASYVDGDKNSEARKTSLKRLARRDLDVVVSTSIFQEGVDVPELRSVVVACGGKSVIAALQRVGRGTRVVQGKETVQIFDILDQGTSSIENHARERLKAYRREGYETLVLDEKEFTSSPSESGSDLKSIRPAQGASRPAAIRAPPRPRRLDPRPPRAQG